MTVGPHDCGACGQPRPLPRTATVGCVIEPRWAPDHTPGVVHIVTEIVCGPPDLCYATLVDGAVRERRRDARSDTVCVVRWATADEAAALLR